MRRVTIRTLVVVLLEREKIVGSADELRGLRRADTLRGRPYLGSGPSLSYANRREHLRPAREGCWG